MVIRPSLFITEVIAAYNVPIKKKIIVKKN